MDVTSIIIMPCIDLFHLLVGREVVVFDMHAAQSQYRHRTLRTSESEAHAASEVGEVCYVERFIEFA